MKVCFDSDVNLAREDTELGCSCACPRGKLGFEDPMELERLAAALSAERTASRLVIQGGVDTFPSGRVERHQSSADETSERNPGSVPYFRPQLRCGSAC
jgi:coenzyme F420-dependent glucose-6-phosphate dehydrogenase